MSVQTKVLCAVAAIALALAGGAVWVYRGERDTARAELAEVRLDAARAQVKAVDDARIEEQRRTAAQTEIANAATKDLESARADAAAANDVSSRVRQRVAELLAASRATGNSAAAGAGSAADYPLGVLADVLSRADQRAGILAGYADAARIAGQACERAYDSLRATLQLAH
ncbi:DUF2514 family protein [Cupriavidus sp. 2TAF22]|uniref:DUF2514 family protein n=1 Tax=unclassified Cupriavidus TaxID=2640874 RepID=UPI003F92EEDB